MRILLRILRRRVNQARKEGKLRLHDVPYFPMPEDSEPAGTRILPEEFAKVYSHLPENLKRRRTDKKKTPIERPG